MTLWYETLLMITAWPPAVQADILHPPKTKCRLGLFREKVAGTFCRVQVGICAEFVGVV